MKQAIGVALLAAALLLSGCNGQRQPPQRSSSPSSEASAPGEKASLAGEETPDQAEGASTSLEQEDPSLPLSEEERTALRESALVFAQWFASPFSAPEELDQEQVGRYALFHLATGPMADQFETDESGFPYIPKVLVQSYVQDHFAIADYQYPLREDPRYVILPQYDAERDAYRFSAAQDGPSVQATLVGEEIDGDGAVYTIRLDTPHMETGQVLETVTLDYTFALLPKEEGIVLQARSASLLSH